MRVSRSKHSPSKNSIKNPSLIYKARFVSPEERTQLLTWLETLTPLWENRFSHARPLPPGQEQRRLLRPVYWLGNWQFACLNYFHPPKNIHDCCIEAEPFPPLLQNIAHRIENEVHDTFSPKDIPRGWHFNTCLINFYGHSTDEQGRKRDAARVGEHKDFEPGPVGSLSFGERALFQFVDSPDRGAKSHVILQQWLEDSALQVFGGDRFKKRLFHRVQRVETKLNKRWGPPITDFETRRINFTFRYVPKEFIVPFHRLPSQAQEDIEHYMKELATHSPFYSEALSEAKKVERTNSEAAEAEDTRTKKPEEN